MNLVIVVEDGIHVITAEGVEEVEVLAMRASPDLYLPVQDLEDPESRHVFARPANDRAPLTRLPVPATNRRLSRLMRRHNR